MSRAVVVRDGTHTVLTVQVDPGDDTHPFFLVIAVPASFKADQAGVVAPDITERLTAISAPQLDVTRDADPCFPSPAMPAATVAGDLPLLEKRETQWEITVLSAAQSAGLVGWLAGRGFTVTPRALPAIRTFQRQHMRFVVARITPTGAGLLPPVRLAYDSPDFTVPTGLGSDAGENLTLLVLARQGQVTVTGRPMQPMPAGTELPEYVADQFPQTYAAMVAHQIATAPMTVFVAYTGPVAVDEGPFFLTRLHLGDVAGQIIRLRSDTDRVGFLLRYRVRVAWKGLYTNACTKGFDYRHDVARRWVDENAALARLTGWAPADIRAAMTAHWNRLRERPPTTE